MHQHSKRGPLAHTWACSGAPNSRQGIGEEGGDVLLIAGGRETAHIHPARVARRLLRRRLGSCNTEACFRYVLPV